MGRHLGTSMVVGVTGHADSPIGQEADICLQIAGDGPSGVACASHEWPVARLARVGGDPRHLAQHERRLLRVDVYLTKRPGYRALLLSGSRYEAEVIEWATERGFPVVVAGGSLPGAALEIDLPGADAPLVRRLVETLAAELVAAEPWARAPA